MKPITKVLFGIVAICGLLQRVLALACCCGPIANLRAFTYSRPVGYVLS